MRRTFSLQMRLLGRLKCEIKVILDLLGDRQFRYGQVAPQTLGFSFKDRVEKPKNGEVYCEKGWNMLFTHVWKQPVTACL
jgi:hypothetical protein